MFYRLFPGMGRTAHQSRTSRCRLGVEQLEDRLVPSSTPAALAVQTQALVNPANLGSGVQFQYIAAGAYQTVASQTVTIGPGQTGLVNLNFQAQAFDAISNRAGVRYLIDGLTDPNDAVFIRGGTTADAIEDIEAGSWQTLFLTRQLNLSAGTHVIAVQVTCTTDGFTAAQQLAVFTPVLSVVGYSVIDGQAAATGLQSETLTNPTTALGSQQIITAGSYQAVVRQVVTVGANKTGLFDLSFQAQAFASSANQVFVRYLIDGLPDPRDLATSATPSSADTTETFNNGFFGGGWHTLTLTHQLVLAAGTHTVAVQVQAASPGFYGPALTVFTPVLSLIGYNNVDGLRSADGVQSQALTNPIGTAAPGQQNITAGSFQTVARQTLTVGPNKTGIYALAFQAQAFATTGNRVWIRYLIDGQPDSTDLAITASASQADSTVDFVDGLGVPTWHTLALTHLLTLSAGTHTISVQVECASPGATLGRDLVVLTPDLALTGFNSIASTAGSQFFSYNAATQVLTISGTTGDDQLQFAQATTSSSAGVLSTLYTLTFDGVAHTFTAGQLARVVVNGNGGSDAAVLVTSNTYLGADGKLHETQEQAVLNPTGGILQKFNASNVSYTFMQLVGFSNVNALMGHADFAILGDSGGDDTFTSSGLSASMAGPGYLDQVSGAQSVTANSTHGGHDQANMYDGSGASTFTASGGTFSSMSGTDQGRSFLNKANGFKFNSGFARHAGDTAYIYAGIGFEVFVCDALSSSLSATDAAGALTMLDTTLGFSHVYARGNPGDIAHVHNTAVNTVTGFTLLP